MRRRASEIAVSGASSRFARGASTLYTTRTRYRSAVTLSPYLGINGKYISAVREQREERGVDGGGWLRVCCLVLLL
jgi:hypothetical protein